MSRASTESVVRAARRWGPAIAVTIVLAILALGVLVMWLSSRGQFMFLHGVAHNVAEVKAPWTQFRKLGNNLFKFNLLLMGAGFGIFIVIVGICLLVALPDIQAKQFESMAITALILFGVLSVIMMIVFGLVDLCVMDFVVPAMYRNDETIGPSWQRVRGEIIAGNGGTIALYVLMKMLLAMALGMITLVATCLTCCIASLPYIGTVILLPLLVFHRCYSLYFIEQFGPKWNIIVPEAADPAPEPPAPEPPAQEGPAGLVDP